MIHQPLSSDGVHPQISSSLRLLVLCLLRLDLFIIYQCLFIFSKNSLLSLASLTKPQQHFSTLWVGKGNLFQKNAFCNLFAISVYWCQSFSYRCVFQERMVLTKYTSFVTADSFWKHWGKNITIACSFFTIQCLTIDHVKHFFLSLKCFDCTIYMYTLFSIHEFIFSLHV